MTADEVAIAVEQLQRTTGDLIAARENLHQAQERLTAARDAVHSQVRATGLAFLRAGLPYPVDVMRSLYWDYPEVHAEALAHAFGLRSASQVYEVVDPDNRSIPCGNGCGADVVRSVRNRSDVKPSTYWRGGSKDPTWCEDCRERARPDEERRAREAREQWAREREAQIAERARLEEAIANGLKPTQVYASYPGFGDVDNPWSLHSLQDVTELVTPTLPQEDRKDESR